MWLDRPRLGRLDSRHQRAAGSAPVGLADRGAPRRTWWEESEMGSEDTASLPRPKCPNCDHVGAIGARFCSNCRTRLDASAVADATSALAEPAMDWPSGAQPAIEDQPESGAILVVTRGADAGMRYLLHIPRRRAECARTPGPARAVPRARLRSPGRTRSDRHPVPRSASRQGGRPRGPDARSRSRREGGPCASTCARPARRRARPRGWAPAPPRGNRRSSRAGPAAARHPSPPRPRPTRRPGAPAPGAGDRLHHVHRDRATALRLLLGEPDFAIQRDQVDAVEHLVVVHAAALLHQVGVVVAQVDRGDRAECAGPGDRGGEAMRGDATPMPPCTTGRRR